MTKQSAIKIILIVLLISAIATAAWLLWTKTSDGDEQVGTSPTPVETDDSQPSPKAGEETELSNEYRSEKGTAIIVAQPEPEETVTSPLTVTGTVPGSWSFEASFPIRLVNADRQELATTSATLQDDWMTDEQVPFTATLDDFTTPSTSTGYLILIKSNPSGLPENDDSLEIPVRF